MSTTTANIKIKEIKLATLQIFNDKIIMTGKKKLTFEPMRNILFLVLIVLCGCSSTAYLRQGTFSKGGIEPNQNVECLFGETPYKQTVDYTMFQCTTDANTFYFMPSNLIVEKDLNSNPLVFFQYLNKKSINVIVKFTYDKSKFIEASNFLKSVSANYNLNILPINSVSITNSTTIPDKNIYYFGTSTYGYFEGYVTFEIHGYRQMDSMRSLLISNNGFQMLYQFDYYLTLITTGSIKQTTIQIPIYIRNINL